MTALVVTDPQPLANVMAPAQMDAMHQSMLSASPAYFASQLLTGPKEAPYHGRFLLGQHLLEWDQLVLGGTKVCIMASRNIGKSHFFSLALPLFYAHTQPGKLTMVIGATMSTAEEMMGNIVQEVETNPKLAHLLPSGGSRKTWNKKNIVLANGHAIKCRGMGVRMRGLHPDNIIGDDLLTDNDASSETARQKTIAFFMSAVTPMLNPGGTMVVVGTPQSQRDLLVGHLRTNPTYRFKVYPAERDKIPTFPKRLSAAYLQERLSDIGSLRYAREYLCQPVSTGSSLFPFDLFKGEPTEQPSVTLGMPAARWKDAGMTLYTGVDIAMSSQVGADYTVVCTIAIDSHGNIWLVDLQRVRGMPYHQQLALIEQIGTKYRPAVIAVESNQAQRFIADELIRTTRLPVVRHTTTAAKHSLEHGIPSMKLIFENRKVRLPRGDDHSIEMTDIFTDELNNFTFMNGKVTSVGEHDDTSMAFYIALQAEKMGAFSASFGPEVNLTSDAPVPKTASEIAWAPAIIPSQAPMPEDPFGFR